MKRKKWEDKRKKERKKERKKAWDSGDKEGIKIKRRTGNKERGYK